MFWVCRAEFPGKAGICRKENLGKVISEFGLLLCCHLVSRMFLLGDCGALQPSSGPLFSLLSDSRRFKLMGAAPSEIVGPHVNKAIKYRKRQMMIVGMYFILSQKATSFDG